jgi:hypothetical protein
MWAGGITGGAADSKHFTMRHKGAARGKAGLYRDRTHVPVVSVVAIGMMQADIDTKVDLVILRIPPTCINDLVRICRGIHGPVRNAIVNAIMTIVIHPGTQAIRPIRPGARIANTGLWRRYPWRRGRRTGLAGFVTGKPNDTIIKSIVRRGVVEDRFL